MIGAILRRLVQTVFVLFGVSALLFLIFFATPGADPTARIAGRNASPEAMAAVRHAFGFDRPIYIQYIRMMEKLFVTRDLASFVNRGERVVPAVAAAAPVTLSLVGGAAVIWVVMSVAAGTLAAAFRGTVIDRGLMLAGLIGISIPVFWLGEVVNLFTQKSLHHTWLFRWVPGSATRRSRPIRCCGSGISCSPGSRWRCSMSASMRACCAPICSTCSGRISSAPRAPRVSAWCR